MRTLALAAVVILSSCATTGDAMTDRAQAREARDAARFLSLAGAGVVVTAPVAVLAAPQDQQGSAVLVAAPVAMAGVAAYAAGGLMAEAAVEGVE